MSIDHFLRNHRRTTLQWLAAVTAWSAAPGRTLAEPSKTIGFQPTPGGDGTDPDLLSSVGGFQDVGYIGNVPQPSYPPPTQQEIAVLERELQKLGIPAPTG
jgi:hypothetical protein